MNDMATALSAAVSGKELMAHCVEFAKRVKLSGTPEELESFHYLKKCLDGYGYRTKLILHDAYISLPRASSVEADRRTDRDDERACPLEHRATGDIVFHLGHVHLP